jgi:hypothetical protein
MTRSQIAFAPGRLRRAGQDPDALGGEHGVEPTCRIPRMYPQADDIRDGPARTADVALKITGPIRGSAGQRSSTQLWHPTGTAAMSRRARRNAGRAIDRRARVLSGEGGES